MRLLREGFSAVNARFHLVGAFTVAALLLRFAVHWMGDDLNWAPLVLGAFALLLGTACGVLGILFQAASGSKAGIPFAGWVVRLLPPVLWVWIKISVVVSGPVALAIALSPGGAQPGEPDPRLVKALFWSGPVLDFAALVLALYSFPLCILWRVRGERGPHLRAGIRILRSRPLESWRLVALLAGVAVLEAAQQWALGPQGYKAAPGYAEGLLQLLGSYLALVAFFGAARVVLARPEAGPAAGDPGAVLPGRPA